jgi:peptide chain release factor 2
LERLERQAADPNLWNDPQAAQTTMRDLARLRAEIDVWDKLSARIRDALELAELNDDSLLPDLDAEVGALEEEAGHLEFRLLLSGPHDESDAILAIHASEGGTEAQDWAAMLLRMYVRWAEARGYKAEILDSLDGEEAGYKSVTLSISGDYAYGYLKSERGGHRLIRLSPFDSAHRRHTSFATVEVWPDIEDTSEVVINPSDLILETFRASSAGGQHVQKNETAVRITHVPTGIVVSCQNERSQTQNRENALKVLRAKLLAMEDEKRREELKALKGEHVIAGFGVRIRSYFLHPYQLITDHRTGYETGNAQAVLDGRLDEFMEAFLRQQVGEPA